MLGKLAYRNTKRNIKDYLIYLITVTTSFSLIFAFNLVASSDEIVKLCSSMDAFKNSLFAVNILITFVIRTPMSVWTRSRIVKSIRSPRQLKWQSLSKIDTSDLVWLPLSRCCR